MAALFYAQTSWLPELVSLKEVKQRAASLAEYPHSSIAPSGELRVAITAKGYLENVAVLIERCQPEDGGSGISLLTQPPFVPTSISGYV